MEFSIYQVISEARKKLAAMNVWSLTTRTFQNNLLDFILDNQAEGDCAIEVGCCQGGLTAQLALITHIIGKKLYVIDIYEPALSKAKEMVQAIAPDADVSYHLGSFDQFVNLFVGKIKPIMAFVDADHTYEGVSADVRSLYRMNPLPYAAVFHDFVLRNTEQGGGYTANVDGALYDVLGKDFLYRPMGAISGIGLDLHTETNRGEGGFYHITGFPEAVLILCSECAPQNAVKVA